MSDQQGWDSYSKLILQQLDNLTKGIDALKIDLHDMKNEMVQLKSKEDKIVELKAWKDKIDDTLSPSQLKNLVKEVDDLKVYKVKAVTIFAVVQFIMAAAVAAVKIFQ